MMDVALSKNAERRKDNEALSSVRSLSGELKISALTVKKAYDKLEEDDFAKAVDRAKSVNMTKEEI